jgi:serine/threonine protein kinase
MVRIIQSVHKKGFILRDIRPESFKLGQKNTSKIYLANLSLVKKYVDFSTMEHIEYAENKKQITGSARYCSLNTSLGLEQSRRDDLESAGIIFVYLAKGVLPWQGLKGLTKHEKNEKIQESKTNTDMQKLGRFFPP